MTTHLTVGSSVEVMGEVKSIPSKPVVEVHATDIQLVGSCSTQDYPLQKKYHSLEFLRDHLHLRARTNTFGAVARVRNALTQGMHSFFQRNDFIQVHTPVLSTNDAEGGGALFRVEPKEFFDAPAFLTCSGQLHAEMLACGLSNVYTFGPTFRAENSHTTRHLAEFWMVEPEMAFATLDDCLTLAQNAVQAKDQHLFG